MNKPLNLRIAVIGRTDMLLRSARRLRESGHEIPLVVNADGAGYGAGADEFRSFAAEIGATFCHGRKSFEADVDSLVAETGCNVAISMNWIGVLPRRILDLFPLGVFNAHPGDLPRYRGNACPNWAIIAGEERVTLCVHRMAEELDAGPIAQRAHLPIAATTDVTDVYAWLKQSVPETFLEVITALAQGNLILTPQPDDPTLSLRCYPRRPEDAAIDWTQSSEQISRLIRASTRPFNGAYSFLEGREKISIWKADIITPPSPFLAIPGQVAFIDQGLPVIACGTGMLALREAEIAGLSREATLQAVSRSLRNRLTAERGGD